MLTALTAAVTRAVAHVEYVTDDAEVGTDPLTFLVTVLGEPLHLAVLGAGGAVTGIGLVGYLYAYASAPREIDLLRSLLVDDVGFLPLLLRLGFGLPLVGAGFSGYFITPAVTVPPDPVLTLLTRLFLVGIGFVLLFGVFARFAAALALVAYVGVAVFVTPTLLLASEYVGGLLAIVLLKSGRPSVDHLHARLRSDSRSSYDGIGPLNRVVAGVGRAVEPYERYTPTVARVGLGINFVITGLYDKLLQPTQALAVVDKYNLTRVVPIDPGLWVVGAGLTEIALGIALLLGLFTRGVATVAFGMFTLTLFALPDDPVLAHISLFGLVTALLITGSGPLAFDNL